jgi:ketosteroid isomerase-like protein
VSQENVEVVRLAFASYNRRDLDAVLDLATEDYLLLPAVAGSVETGGIRGREGLRRYFEMIDETWEEFRINADEFRDLGERVLAIGHTEGRGRGSGVVVDAPYGAIFDFRDGRWWRAQGYLDHDEVLRAAGLEE